MINLKWTMGLKSSKHKAWWLSSSEIIILFVAFIAIGLSTLTLVMNVYRKSSAKSFLSNTLINVPIKEIEYENDEYLTKYTSALKAIDSKLDYHTIGSVLMESDWDVNKEKITIVYYDGWKTIRSKEEGWSMDDDHDGICYYSDDMN